MRVILTSLLLLVSAQLQSDTMEHYMNISNQIPQMLLKADEQSQAWARSAQSVLVITNESIAETLLQVNESAKAQGKPLFCLPSGVNLDAASLNELIGQTYKNISSQQSDKNKMTVSQVAWLGVTKAYPCQAQNPVVTGVAGVSAFFTQQKPSTMPSKFIADTTPAGMQHVSALEP